MKRIAYTLIATGTILILFGIGTYFIPEQDELSAARKSSFSFADISEESSSSSSSISSSSSSTSSSEDTSKSHRNGDYLGLTGEDRENYGKFYGEFNKPLTYGEDFSGTIGVEIFYKSYWKIQASFESPLTNGVQYFPKYPLLYPKTAGSNLEVNFEIDKSYIAKRGNKLTVKATTPQGAGKYWSSYIQDSVFLNSEPLEIEAAIGDKTYSSGNRFLVFDEEGYMYSSSCSYCFEGLKNEQLELEADYLVFFDGKLNYSDPYGNSFPGEAELRLYSLTEDFEIGLLYENQYRYFSLLEETEGEETSFSLEEVGYIDRRNLYMHKSVPNKFFTYPADKLFIPTGLGRVGEIYEFKLVISNPDTGDNFVYPIDFSRSIEKMGNGLDSEYRVEGGSV